jgi:pimeloyl-ACP methyl ester carboxylesterase
MQADGPPGPRRDAPELARPAGRVVQDGGPGAISGGTRTFPIPATHEGAMPTASIRSTTSDVLFMKHGIPHAGLWVVPMTGHTVNIEEPALFNLQVAEFLASVENGRWGTWKRGPR